MFNPETAVTLRQLLNGVLAAAKKMSNEEKAAARAQIMAQNAQWLVRMPVSNERVN